MQDIMNYQSLRSHDALVPQGKWQFNEEVTGCFDNMLARSIPQYHIMRKASCDVAKRYMKPGTDIVDLGTSNGGALSGLLKECHHNRFIAVEISEPMVNELRQRFKEEIIKGIVEVQRSDLRHSYPEARASVTLSVLTLQFTPIEYRQSILKRIFNTTIGGGVLVLVEKVLGSTAELDDMLMSIYYEHKKKKGYTEEQIMRKKLSLEGVLVPVTFRWNEELLYNAGFRQVECFWRWMNFAGWIAIK